MKSGLTRPLFDVCPGHSLETKGVSLSAWVRWAKRVGSDIQNKAYNLRRNLDEECVSLIESVAVKPSLAASST